MERCEGYFSEVQNWVVERGVGGQIKLLMEGGENDLCLHADASWTDGSRVLIQDW